MNVHNHGPEEGPGLACREQRIGKCQLDALRSRCESLEAALQRVSQELWSKSVSIRRRPTLDELRVMFLDTRDALDGIKEQP